MGQECGFMELRLNMKEYKYIDTPKHYEGKVIIGIFLIFVLTHAVFGEEYNNVVPKQPRSYVIPLNSLRRIPKRYIWIQPRGYEAAYFRAIYKLNKKIILEKRTKFHHHHRR